MRKILITPFFGDLPPWFDKFEPPVGYEWLLDTDLESFKKRVKDKLGIDYPGEYGSSKVWDYRCALGLLYEDEIEDYSVWGHCDFDVVFGDVNKWVTDEILDKVIIWSNHHSYVNGCFSLYKNCDIVNNLFKRFGLWEHMLRNKNPLGWVEQEYSRIVETSGFKYSYNFFQGWPYTTTPNLAKENGKLYQDGEEIMMFHFRRSKKWPL